MKSKRKKVKKMPDGGKVDPTEEQRKWLESYLQSPKYRDRLQLEMGKGKNISPEIQARLANLQGAHTHYVNSIGKDPGWVSGEYIAKQYKGEDYVHSDNKWVPSHYEKDPIKHIDSKGDVYFETEYKPGNTPNSGYNTIPTHEFSHAVDDGGYRIPQSTIKKIYDNVKPPDKEGLDAAQYRQNGMEFRYQTTPTEFIGRMQPVRYLLQKKGIYDARTQDFNSGVYDKMMKDPDIQKDTNFSDLMDNIKGNDKEKKTRFIELMNTIASNSSAPSNTARDGKQIMKVKSKQLDYSSLFPEKKKGKLLKADDGTPIDPRIKKTLDSMPQGYFDLLKMNPNDLSPVRQSTPYSGQPSNIDMSNANGVAGPQIKKKQPFNANGQIGEDALLALSAFDAMTPYGKINKQQVVQPQAGYTPYAYGTGSQALKDGGWLMSTERDKPYIIPEGAWEGSPSAMMGMNVPGMSGMIYGHDNQDMSREVAKDGHWIQKAVNPKHKGYCTPMTKSTCTPRRKALAKTFKKHHGFHEEGGIIPDPMSNFSPHMYEQGGLIPQVNLLEQLLPWDTGEYRQGGSLRGGSDTVDLMEQLLPWDTGDYQSGGQINLMEQLLPWDTGEYKSGGQLTSGKAKEILRDGTAQGHKLTAKQKRYFGWIAGGGKADMGMPIGPETGIPSTLKGAKGQPFYGGTNDSKAADLSDFISYNLVNMGKDKDYRGALIKQATEQYGADKAKKLFNSIDMYNQRSDRKNYPGEAAINNYYSLNDPDKDVQDIKNHFKTFGGSPTSLYHNSPYIKGMNPDGSFKYLAQNKDGGMIYDDGGQVGTMWGGNVEQISDNPHDGGTMQFSGDSHDQGGIGMHYNGKQVEVEGGETATKDSQGNLNIMGNMNLPGTSKKFKTVSKEIAAKEKRYDFLKTKGATLVNDADVSNKFQKLSFNAGKVMMEGGSMGQKEMADTKEKLSDLQKAMLETAHENGIDPQEMSKGNIKKAKYGAKITRADSGYAEDGDDGEGDPNDKGRSTRNKNPGNIKYGKFAQSHGATGQDKDGFAIFPDKNTGRSAMQNLLRTKTYNNQNIDDAIGKWTGGSPYRYNLPDELKGKKVSDLNDSQLNNLMDIMTKGEDSRYGVPTKKDVSTTPTQRQTIPAPDYTPYGLPNANITPDQTPQVTPVTRTPPDDKLGNVQPRPTLPTNAEPLHFGEVAGEMFAAATNRQIPVASQKYQPQLYSPYQVSFQDRINANQNTFSGVARQVGEYNPSALGTLAANKYSADSAVKGEEFRTNQGIANDIINKNTALENDAQLKNLQLADTQYTRQSQAQSKTRELNQMIVNSLSSKYAQNQLEGKRLKAYENLYDYRFQPNDKGGNTATYLGPDAMFSYNNRPNPYGQSGQQPGRSAIRYDAYGNVKSVTQYTEDELRNYHEELENEALRRNMKWLTVPPL